jgi:sugar-specific transcriptional regulator TrmB
MSTPAEALVPFGFTGLESLIYSFLVAESPATGYRIAQATGKPVANTYKAIQTLLAKGAIVVEDGEARLCRAVPPDELLDRLSRAFEESRNAAKGTLAKIAKGEEDDRVYSIRANAQTLQRARTMLTDARTIALLAARADAIEALRDGLADAASRSVDISIKSDAELNIPRAEVFVANRPDDLLKQGPFFRLVVDAKQCLVGRLGSGKDEADIIWSRSRPLSMTLHEGLAAELNLLAVAERLEDGAGPKRLARALTQVRSAGVKESP